MIGDCMKYVIKVLILTILMMVNVSVKAEPANDSFVDDNLYKCIIDAYNLNRDEKKDITYNILPEELNEITTLDCSKSGPIESLIGLNKMIGVTSLNLGDNTFIGGSLSLKEKDDGSFKSNIILPPKIVLTDITYSIENEKIVSEKDGTVTGLFEGSTYVTMTAKITGNIIKEKYLVSVVGNGPKSENATLSSLTLSKGELNFKSDVNKYSVIVSNATSSITINARLDDNKATFVSGFGPRKVTLKQGVNTVYLKVKAENGTVNTYTLSITRSDGNDANNLLANIELSPGEIDFKSDVNIYTLTVDYEVEKIDVRGIAESTLATVDISDTNLKVGENKIAITVTAENKSTSEYQLIVNREGYESKKNYLNDLKISGYNIDFSKDKFNYDLKIKNEDTLGIIATTLNTSASISVIGNKNLKNNSIITIKVTDEDNVTRDYTISVQKSIIYNFSYKEWSLLAEFLIIIILIFVIIFKSKNKNKTTVGKRKKYMLNENVNNKICTKCGAINDPLSNTCYVCGKEIR